MRQTKIEPLSDRTWEILLHKGSAELHAAGPPQRGGAWKEVFHKITRSFVGAGIFVQGGELGIRDFRTVIISNRWDFVRWRGGWVVIADSFYGRRLVDRRDSVISGIRALTRGIC